MRQQSGEGWDEREDMDDNKDNKGGDGEEDERVEDVVEGEQQSPMPRDRQTIVIDVGLLCFSYLERYQTQ